MLLLVARLGTLCNLTSPRPRVTTGSPTFTTTHRVINRVHGYTAHAGATSLPAVGTSLAHCLKTVVRVGASTHSGLAISKDAAGFTRRQFDDRVVLLAAQQDG